MTLSSRPVLTLRLLLVLLASTTSMEAFHIFSPSRQMAPCLLRTPPRTCLAAKKNKKGKRGGKGFGEAPITSKKKEASSTTSSESFTPMPTKPEPSSTKAAVSQPNQQASSFQVESSRTQDRSDTTRESEMNMGQKALERMRREQAEKKDAELRRVKEIRDTDKMLQSSPEAAAIPEKVAMRMGKRMLPFVGIPLFGSMAAFVGFWYLSTYKNVEFQPGMVATTTIAILASGLLGITYSIVSASWDEDREGSALGIEEFQRNVGNIQEGLARSKENLILREKMAGMPEEKIEAAIADLERREKRQQSFQDKIGQELEK